MASRMKRANNPNLTQIPMVGSHLPACMETMAHQVVPQMKTSAMSMVMIASVTTLPPNNIVGLPNPRVLMAITAVPTNVPPYQSGIGDPQKNAGRNAEERPQPNLAP